jgi:ribonuclease P protein component
LLPKINRITKKRDFDRIFKKGAGFKEGFLFLKIIAGELKQSRFAFVVGKKVSNKATVRNKIRRQLRKLMEEKIKGINKIVDGVFIALQGAERYDFREMEKTFIKLLKKTKIIQ